MDVPQLTVKQNDLLNFAIKYMSPEDILILEGYDQKMEIERTFETTQNIYFKIGDVEHLFVYDENAPDKWIYSGIINS